MDDSVRGHRAASPVRPAAQPVPSSELLGFPPGARVLIVNCDDLGMYPAIDDAVVRSVEDGIAGSCSLMVPCPSAPHAIRLLRERPQIPFGIHLTMVCDTPRHRWGPVAPREEVRSLLDPAGELFAPTPAGRAALLAQARIGEVEREFRAQIDAVHGQLAPTHLDFHCLADGGREDILDLTVALAAEYGLAVRVWLDAGRDRMRRRGLPVVDNAFLDSFSLPLDGKAAGYAGLLRALPPGLTEWAVHPGLGGAQARAVDDGWRVRRTDYDFLTSPAARRLVREEDITLTDYRPLRRAWTERNSGAVQGPWGTAPQ